MINYAIAIKQIYPDIRPSIDFSACLDVDGRQYVAEWNYSQPQPTEEELQVAWDEYEANPPQEQLSEIDVLGQQLVQKDIELIELQAVNDSLGEQIVEHDIRLMMGGL